MVTLAFLVPLARLVDQLAEDRALTGAERDAQLVAQFVGAAATSIGTREAFAAVTSEGTLGGRAVTLLLPDGSTAGAAPTAEEDVAAAFEGTAIRTATEGGQVVAVPSVLASGEVAVVRVFVEESELSAGVVRSWVVLGLLGATLVMIAIAVTDRLARSMVAPVEALSAAAGRLGAGDLATTVEPAGPPELVRVSEEFNRLTNRVRAMLQQERESAADLSHRLRTPLAALRLDIESLESSAGRQRLLDDLDSVERAVTHVIHEARRPLRADDRTVVDLGRVVRERHDFWLALAEEQGRPVALDLPSHPVPVAGPEADLVAAIDALLGNVLAHTPPGTAYATAVRREVHDAVLVVGDEGAGFPDPDVLARGRSTSGSTGLGLDIVRRTAQAAGGSLAISNSPAGGAEVVVRLPLVPG
jgi:signal transduction histidine kinase